MMKKTGKLFAIAASALVLASCSSHDDWGSNSMESLQSETYQAAFKEAFGTPAANQNWGFGEFTMVEAPEPIGSWTVMEEAGTRAVATSVTPVRDKRYNTVEEFMADPTPKAYFWLRIDNNVVDERAGWQNNSANDYYPKSGLDLGNGVKDAWTSTDNEGMISQKVFQSLNPVTTTGLQVATVDQPLPDELFLEAPSFETMALHVPDARKIELAGSVEAFNTDNFKIFWYVAKWQPTGCIHVDGVIVTKDQMTVNIPEYRKRIIVEDLKGNISATTKVNTSDFDFNDVVFDAVTWKNGGKSHLKVIVRAAGGQMPIYVAGKEVHEGVGYMFNTSDPDYEFGHVLIEDSIINTAADKFDFNSIPVEIEANGVKTAAGSNIGEAPEKIAVDLDYKWCKERQSIKDVYPRFSDYVADKTITKWWEKSDAE